MQPTVFSTVIAIVVAVLITQAVAHTTVAAHATVGCGAKGGEDLPLEGYFPDLSNGFSVTEEQRDAEQLAATFPDPADVLSRLQAWCWLGQIERTYTRGGLTIDISLHEFTGPEGATLAERWFSQQRVAELGLQGDGFMTPLQRSDVPRPIFPVAFFNGHEYTLYFRPRGDILARVTVTGGDTAIEADNDVIAYQVMDLIEECGDFHCWRPMANQ